MLGVKKTNLMIEVTDELYNEIVEPYKKRKSFGKLVVQLLEAYRTNDKIYSYINGTIDGLEDEATDELIKDLNSMAQSLSMFGALQNQAEANIDEGVKAFNDFGNRASSDRDKYTTSSSEVLTRDDVVGIVNDSVSDIRGMLETLITRDTAPRVQEVAPVRETPIISRVVEKAPEPVRVETAVIETPNVIDSPDEFDLFEEEPKSIETSKTAEESSVSEEESLSFFEGLLDGAVF